VSGNSIFSALSSFFIYDESKDPLAWGGGQTGVAHYLEEQNRGHEQAMGRAVKTGVDRYLVDHSYRKPEIPSTIPEKMMNTGVGRYLVENSSPNVSTDEDVSERRVIVEAPEQTNNQEVQPSSGGILGAISSFFIYREPVATAPRYDSGTQQGDTGVDKYLAGFEVVLTDLVEEEQNDADQITSSSTVDQYLDDLEEEVLAQNAELEAIQEDFSDGVEESTSVEDVVLDAVQEEVVEHEVEESLEKEPFRTGVELYLEDNVEAPVTSVSKYLSKRILLPVADEPEVLSGVVQYINNQESDALLVVGSSGVSSYLTSIAREKLIAESEAIIAQYRAEEELSQSFKKAIKPIVDRDIALAYAEARQHAQETPSAITQYLSAVAELDSSLPTLSGVDQYLLQQKFNGGDICSYTGVDKYLITLTARPDAAPIELEGSGVERYLSKL
jgi:hypothetical protein